ncbi:MAG: hypothetical protein LBI06_05290 [Treponema sp.]|nr:hypothetical protein [Treponema sp.]
MASGRTLVIESGYIIEATSTEIITAKDGETEVYDRLRIDGSSIIDIAKNRLTKKEPQMQKQ